MDVKHIIAAHILFDLTDGFHERFAFDIAHGAADFGDDKIGILLAAHAVDPFLDLIRDMRNDLYGTAQIITAAFLFDDGLIDPAGSHIGMTAQIDIDETFIMTQVEVSFRPIIGDEDFAVLVRAHRAGVDVDVRIELLNGDLISSALQQTAQRSSRNPFAQRRNHAARHKNILGHFFPPLYSNQTYICSGALTPRIIRPWRRVLPTAMMSASRACCRAGSTPRTRHSL